MALILITIAKILLLEEDKTNQTVHTFSDYTENDNPDDNNNIKEIRH